MSITAAEFINALLSDYDIGDRFLGETIDGEVKLLKPPVQPLVLKGVRFAAVVKIADVNIESSVSLDNCEFMLGLEIDGVTINGSLSIENGNAEHLSLTHVRLHRDFNASRFTSKKHLTLQMSEIGGTINMSGAKIDGEFACKTTNIVGDLMCWSVPDKDIAAPTFGRVWLGTCTIRGSAFFDSSQISGALIFFNTDISGDLRCSCIERPQSTRPIVAGGVELTNSKIEGSVIFDHLKTKYIRVRNGTLRGDFNCRSRYENIPPDRTSSDFAPEIQEDLSIDNTELRGSCDFRGIGVTELRIISSKVGCNVQCGTLYEQLESNIQNLLLQSCVINGTLDLWSVKGAKHMEVSITRIGGNMLCQCATEAESPTEPNGSSFPPSRMILSGTRVKGYTSLRGCRLESFEAERSRFEGGLHFGDFPPRVSEALRQTPGLTNLRKVTLRHCPVGGKLDLSDIWLNGEVELDAVSFETLELGRDPDYSMFLSKTTFNKSTYLLIERHLRAQGDDRDADRVYRDMRRLSQLEGSRPSSTRGRDCVEAVNGFGRRLWGRFYDHSMGYGTTSTGLFFYFLFSFVFLTCVFSNQRSVEWSAMPTVLEITQNPGLSKTNYYPKMVNREWDVSDAMFMALRVTVPYISFSASREWEPSRETLVSWDSLRFSVGDIPITSATVLLGKLGSETPDALSSNLWNHFSTEAKAQMQDTKLSWKEKELALLRAINTILEGVSIYDTASRSNFRLSSETDSWAKRNPNGRDLIRLNRMVLADAYDLEIPRTEPRLLSFFTYRFLATIWGFANFLALPFFVAGFSGLLKKRGE
jgi:hypothetical protein